jgi:hypothetical protein
LGRELLQSADEILEFNKSAGLRMNSQSDFRVWQSIDMAQAIAHLYAIGGMGHVYLRKPAMIDIFGDVGIKYNMSVEMTDPVN